MGADLEPGTLLTAYRRACSRCRSVAADGSGGGRPTPARPAARRLPPLRCSRRSMRHYEVRVDTAFEAVVATAATPADPTAGSRRRSARRTSGCTSSGGPTAWRPGGTASWSVGCTAWPSAGCSPASRCSTAARRLEGRRGRHVERLVADPSAARRPVDDTPPRQPRCGRDPADGVPPAPRPSDRRTRADRDAHLTWTIPGRDRARAGRCTT